MFEQPSRLHCAATTVRVGRVLHPHVMAGLDPAIQGQRATFNPTLSAEHLAAHQNPLGGRLKGGHDVGE
jgi:hypothetical protein